MKRPKTTDKECKRQGMTDVPVANYSKMQDKYIDYLESQTKQRVIEELEELLTKEIESFGVNVISSQAVINKIKQLKQE